jgi:thiosulfate/3-mercaptopyruvate sulfurtransferase
MITSVRSVIACVSVLRQASHDTVIRSDGESGRMIRDRAALNFGENRVEGLDRAEPSATTESTLQSMIIDSRFRFGMRTVLLVLAALCVSLVTSPRAWGGYTYVRAATIPESALVQPAALAALLQVGSGERPLMLQVGAHVLYVQAHIPGSEYVGPGEDDAGLKALRARVAKLPKSTRIVLYCGCCPWDQCRNIGGAYAALRKLGFTEVKVLYLESDFGSNWVDQGYPVARGE